MDNIELAKKKLDSTTKSAELLGHIQAYQAIIFECKLKISKCLEEMEKYQVED